MNPNGTNRLLLVADSKTSQRVLAGQLKKAFPQISIASCLADGTGFPEDAKDCFTVFSDKQTCDAFFRSGNEQRISTYIIGTEVFTPDTLFRILENMGAQIASDEFSAKYTFADVVGKSPAVTRLKASAEKIARTDLSVLIEGGTGTGKKLFAHAIHSASQRAPLPFITINLSSPADALQNFHWLRRGAGGGSIFLNHIDDASMEVQSELLSILEGCSLSSRVRLIAASSCDLRRKCSENTFRQDLYYRLREGYLYLPPLEDRREDIPLLIEHWAKTRFQCSKPFSPDVIELLADARWPGNIRELLNLIKFAIAVSERDVIIKSDLPYDELRQTKRRRKTERGIPSETDETTLAILSAVHQLNERNEIASRNRIYWYLKDSGSQISEYRIRKTIPKMAIQGLLSSGHGKYGLALTDKGIMILEMYHKK